jgi:hypothetical protein
MNCKDPGSEAKLAQIDTCLEQLAANDGIDPKHAGVLGLW